MLFITDKRIYTQFYESMERKICKISVQWKI